MVELVSSSFIGTISLVYIDSIVGSLYGLTEFLRANRSTLEEFALEAQQPNRCEPYKPGALDELKHCLKLKKLHLPVYILDIEAAQISQPIVQIMQTIAQDCPALEELVINGARTTLSSEVLDSVKRRSKILKTVRWVEESEFIKVMN